MSSDLVVGGQEGVNARALLLSDDEMRRTWRVASALATSGMFKDARQAEQAFAKILLGRDLGLSPTQAMTGIYIVEGKPVVAATMLASFVQRTPGYDYKVVTLTEKLCEIDFFLDADLLGRSSFSIEDAQLAGLVRQNSPWVKFPRNMLFARAMSNGVRWFAPAATQGIAVYYEGEIESDALQLTAAAGETSDSEPDYGDDQEVADGLREVFGLLGYRPAKVKMMLAGCESGVERSELLTSLSGKVPVEAELVEESQ